MTIKARVRAGRLIVDEPTDLPEGTELQLLPLDPGDWLDEADRAALHEALRESDADVAAGRLVDAEEILKELRSRRIPAQSDSRRRHAGTFDARKSGGLKTESTPMCSSSSLKRPSGFWFGYLAQGHPTHTLVSLAFAASMFGKLPAISITRSTNTK